MHSPPPAILPEPHISSLEETLTLHKLGLFQEICRSLKTSNCIESLMSLIGQKLGIEWVCYPKHPSVCFSLKFF